MILRGWDRSRCRRLLLLEERLLKNYLFIWPYKRPTPLAP